MPWPGMAACGLAAVLLASLVAAEPTQQAVGLLAKRADLLQVTGADAARAAASLVEEGGVTREEDQTLMNIHRTIRVVFRTWLTDPEGQLANAASATLAGLILLAVDCRVVFKWFGVGSVAMFMMLLAMHEVRARWPFGFAHGAAPVVGVEAAILSILAALRGYRGLMVIVGACLGLFLAHLVQTLCFDLGYQDLQTSYLRSLALFTVFMLGGILMVRRKAHMLLLVYVNPFLGGALVSSALCWCITVASVEGYAGTWADSLQMLCSGNAEDVELFGGPGRRWFGIALWFGFFVLGAVRQETIIRRQKAEQRALDRKANWEAGTN